MKRPLALILVLNVLFLWQTCLIAEVKMYNADICVYGGTASGVMAALAAEKEGSKVILIEPTRWLGGMTGGGSTIWTGEKVKRWVARPTGS